MSFIAARVLHPGSATGVALVLEEPLSFWGGFDPVSGRIVDRHHPQAGTPTAGRLLVLPGSRGSAGTPAGIAEAIRLGSGPAAFLLATTDVNIATGARVAARLYGIEVAVLTLGAADYSRIATGDRIEIGNDGRVVFGEPGMPAEGPPGR